MVSKAYRDLELWQTAMDAVVEWYQAAQRFPRCEMFGLSGQLRRAVVSVPANVAEGHGRQHRPEFIQHFHIALGSLADLETHVQIAQRLGYLEPSDAEKLTHQTGEVGRLLSGMLRYLQSKTSSAPENPGPSADNQQPTTDNRRPL